MPTQTDLLFQLVTELKSIEDSIVQLESERQRLDEQIAELKEDSKTTKLHISHTVNPNAFVPGTSARQAFYAILREAGDAGISFDELRQQVVNRSNRGTPATINSYLEREKMCEPIAGTDRWRLRT